MATSHYTRDRDSITSSGLDSASTAPSAYNDDDDDYDFTSADEETPLLRSTAQLIDAAEPGEISHSFLVSNTSICVFRIASALFYFFYISWRLSLVGIAYFWWFTDWSWSLNLIYFTSAAALSLIPGPGRFHYRLQKHLFSAMLTSGLLVSLTFWSVIIWELPEQLWEREKVDLIIGHSLNLLLPMIELCLNKITIGFSHGLSPNLFLLNYQVFLLALRISGFTLGTMKWPYPFLDEFAETEDGKINYGGLAFVAILFSLVTSSITALTIFLVRKRNLFFVDAIAI